MDRWIIGGVSTSTDPQRSQLDQEMYFQGSKTGQFHTSERKRLGTPFSVFLYLEVFTFLFDLNNLKPFTAVSLLLCILYDTYLCIQDKRIR